MYVTLSFMYVMLYVVYFFKGDIQYYDAYQVQTFILASY